jgi:quercetin dioxygenase-like cupin family protein
MAIVRTPDQYFVNFQYNWSGKYDGSGKKIPGTKPEVRVRGLHHPQGNEGHKSPFSMIDFTVYAGCSLNPVRFKTIANVAHVTSGSGVLKINDVVYRIKAEDTIEIPALTTYTFENDAQSDLTLVMVSTPPWFKEDEEYEWDLVGPPIAEK